MKYRHLITKKSRSGFSLVEIVLALLVVAIGLLAVFALFPVGLQATRSSVDDLEIALFSEYVFSTLEVAASTAGAGWTIRDTYPFQSLALSHTSPPSLFQLVDGNRQAVFYWIPDYFGSSPALFWTSAFTYQLDIIDGSWKKMGSSGVVKSAILKVWPGEFPGAPPRQEDTRIFYREILPLR